MTVLKFSSGCFVHFPNSLHKQKCNLFHTLGSEIKGSKVFRHLRMKLNKTTESMNHDVLFKYNPSFEKHARLMLPRTLLKNRCLISLLIKVIILNFISLVFLNLP